MAHFGGSKLVLQNQVVMGTLNQVVVVMRNQVVMDARNQVIMGPLNLVAMGSLKHVVMNTLNQIVGFVFAKNLHRQTEALAVQDLGFVALL